MFTYFHRLLQLFGGRCIIVEEGEARYVVLPIKEYLALSGKSSDEVVVGESQAEARQNMEYFGADKGVKRPRRAGEEDATARRYDKSGRDLSGEPRAERAGEGDADDRREDATARRGGADDRREDAATRSGDADDRREDESSLGLTEDIGRGRNEATEETAIWAGEADDAWREFRLSGQDDVSPFSPGSSSASPKRVEAGEAEVTPKAMAPEPIPERPRSEYRIEDIPF